MKILIVDDDKSRANSLANYLSESIKHESISIASCSSTAKSLLRNRYFDVLILDVSLPRRLHGRSSPEIGLQLLSQVTRAAFLNKPERIIGITAHVEDIAQFRSHFDELCHSIIEAPAGDSTWRGKISRSLEYTYSSKIARFTERAPLAVVTLHGIRTYGSWQNRLTRLVLRHTDKVKFYEYKYGYFSAARLLVPWLRNREVKRLQERMSVLRDVDSATRVLVICHSFGTYLAAEAVKNLAASGHELPQLTLILCGTVLRSDYDWSFLPDDARLVNECGADDYVLLLSEAFVPGFGMAGKVGFHGFNRSGFRNRYYRGGHSLYFESDKFMEENWLPLLASDAAHVKCVDDRDQQGLLMTGTEGIARIIGRVKSALTFGR